MTIKSHFIAPWALPKEGIPIHLMWDPKLKWDKVKIRLPKDFKLKEFLNVDEVLKENSTFIIKKLKTPGYFGSIILNTKIYEDQIVERDVDIKFLFEEKLVQSQTLKAKIFRPKVRIIEIPDEIIITDDSNVNELINIKIKHMGFGGITFKIDVLSEHRLISQDYSLERLLLMTLLEEEIRMKGPLDEENEFINNKNLEIEKEKLVSFMVDFRKRIEEGNIINEEFSQEDADEAIEWLKNSENEENLNKILISFFERVLFDALGTFLDRRPNENVTMEKSNIKADITHQESITVRINYRDSIGNDYETIERKISIKDQRNKKPKIIAPVNILWENEKIKVE